MNDLNELKNSFICFTIDNIPTFVSYNFKIKLQQIQITIAY